MATKTVKTVSQSRLVRPARPALTHLAQHVFGVPLAYQASKLEVLINAIGPRLLTDPKLWSNEEALSELRALGALGKRQLEDSTGTGHRSASFDSTDPAERRPYQVTPTGVAIIPIQGTLMKKSWGMFGLSGASSYESIGADIECAATNPEVAAILLDVDSPGGETHGLFELSDLIYSLRSAKPIWSIANDLAASAAYTIASATSRIWVTRTGGVGSIGIVSCHMDQSGADAKAGLKFTYVFAGDRKIDGNPHQPMSGQAKAEWQSEVDRQYAMFTETVARNRSMKSIAGAVDTEARVFYAETALPVDLADAVGTFEDALAALEAEIAPGSGTSSSLDRAAKNPARSSQVAAGAAQGGRKTAITTQGATMAKKSKQALAAELEAIEEKRKKLKAEIVAIDSAAVAAAKKAKMKSEEADAEAEDAEADAATDATVDAATDPDCPDAEADDADYSGEDADAEDADAAVPSDDDEDDPPAKPAKGKKAVAATATATSTPIVTASVRSPMAVIAEICELAGKPNMATRFIRKFEAGQVTVKGVRNYFLDQRAKASNDPASRTTGAVQPAGSSQLDTLETQANTLAANSDGKLSKAQAYVQLLTKNPSQYAAYVKERNFGVRDAMAAEKYLQTLGQRFPTGVLG